MQVIFVKVLLSYYSDLVISFWSQGSTSSSVIIRKPSYESTCLKYNLPALGSNSCNIFALSFMLLIIENLTYYLISENYLLVSGNSLVSYVDILGLS